MPKAVSISVGVLLGGGAIAAVLAFGPGVWSGPATAGPTGPGAAGAPAAVPVEIATVRTGAIELRRTFSASLEASARVVVASRTSGRVRELSADIGDPVGRGDALATLDTSEYEQIVLRDEAGVALAKARLTEAENLAVITEREFERLDRLNETGDAPDTERDRAWAEYLSANASVEVTRAQVAAAEAALSAARIRLENATIRAEWSAGDATRVLAERWVEEGDTLGAGDPVATVVEIDPIEAVMFVTETDYARLALGQGVSLRTDAHPGRAFGGVIARIAPVFRSGSRQARVEIRLDNPDAALKPGMFARATVVLDRVENATVVPEVAVVRRLGAEGVFVVDAARQNAAFVPVTTGITQDGETAVTGPAVDAGRVAGSVVTLGQQFLSERGTITIPEPITGSLFRADAEPDGSGDGAGE